MATLRILLPEAQQRMYVCGTDDLNGCALPQYFTAPLPFLQESTSIHKNGTRMELELSETRPENQYIYTITCIQIDTTNTTPLLDTFTLICTSAHCDFKNTFL